jgi:hypothetical protein
MTEESDPAGSQPYATFVVELLLGEHREVRRTRVDHVQTGARGMWSGWNERSLLDFMVARALLAPISRVRQQQPLTAADSGLAGALAVKVDRLSITLVRSGLEVERHVGARLQGQVRFAVVGAKASQVSADQTPYAVQILACELTSGKTVMLATTQQRLRPQVLDYMAVVEFVLPDAGRFHLQVVVLLSEAEALGVTLGPVVVVTRMTGGPDA